jgi:anti-sigma factor RsiW
VNGEHWIDRLSDYLDGELDALDRREAEAHLATCSECSRILADLRTIKSQARNLPDRMPTTDLWPAIATGMAESSSGVIDLGRRLDPAASVPSRAIRLSIPQLVAASVALALFSGALSWSFASAHGSGGGVTEAAPPGIVVAAGNEVAVFAPEYADELKELQTILDEHRAELSPETRRVLEKNIGIIDSAIFESMRALEDDPANTYLQAHVDRAFQRKVDLLRETSQIAGWAL